MEKNHGEGHGYVLSRLKELRAVHKREIKSVGDVATNLRDEAQIFMDILPGYKIKELTEAEKQQMKSKEVRNLQSVEQTILMYYRKFVGNVVGLAHKKSDDAQYMAVNCLVELLPAAQDFNYGSSVIDTVVDRANSRNPRLAQMCITGVRDLLSAPTPNDAVLSCLQCICDQVKDRGHLVNHRLLASLMCIRIKIIDVHARDIIKEKKIKQQQKKDDKEIAKAMSKGEASIGRVEQAKMQTQMLNKVLTCYLRILEICKTAPRYRQSLLLGPTMEGLAKFAHMIDFSLFELLLQAISDILDGESATLAAMLNGIITVATLAISTQKDAVTSDGVSIDIGGYYERLFAILPAVLDASSHHDERSRIDEEQMFDGDGKPTDDATSAVSMVAPRGRKSDPPRNTLKERTDRGYLALKALDLLLLQPKKVSMTRVAAFYRRLEHLALHTTANISVAILAFTHKLLQKYPNLAVLHDGGEEAAGAAYDYEVDVPDHVSAMSSVSWEVPLLRRSYHPLLRDYASHLLRNHKGLATNRHKASAIPSTLLGVDHTKAVKLYDTSNGGFNPLPADINKRMDKAALKRARQAAAMLQNSEAAEDPEEPLRKKRKAAKAVPAALECA
eukprot:TRINITY_DN20196_c0_g1_i1.p1 TRINITY_DN20196_c0_g1~~TRINITY_DN20196_c0_g1_i1.p1  ORF type:complete len:637 (+),score=245.51 TRINITY_DN20196_c0_g1_i1:64-1911(+)